VGDTAGTQGFEVFSERVEPHSPGLRSRVWYGGGSLRSAQWAGETGLHFMSSNVIRAEESEVFEDIQEEQIRLFRSVHPAAAAARASQGLVVIPTDSATPEQRAKYAAFVDARTPRTAEPQGPQRLLFARDLIGTSDQLAEQLYAHRGFQQVDEVVFALPFTFEHDDYVQMLTDIATRLGPALGWSPSS
jgi:alkanesulfonate monooxygenase SsuD/methylene tetrahydromethanopterin reductase-like flavin-dependent oxidoreductase (luciferase family)